MTLRGPAFAKALRGFGVTFTLDRLGRQTAITDATGTRTFTYNDALQLAAETNVTGTIARQYDSLGRSSGFVGSSGSQVAYGYSSDGRFASLSNAATSAVQYSYLPGSGLLTGYATSAGFGFQRTYEPHRDAIATISNTWNGAAIGNFRYSNDALARRVARVDNSTVSNAFGYNLRSELTSAIMGTNTYGYAFDPIGNRRSATKTTDLGPETIDYAANVLNQYTSISDGDVVTPAYDSDGNLTNCAGRTYAWDAENRLLSVQSSGAVIANYKYDYMSRRYQKAVGSTTNIFLYDGWNLIHEISTSGSTVTTNTYTWGPDLSGSLQGAGGIGGLVSVTISGAGNPTATYYPCYDANGNITDYVNTNGAIVAHREFDAFGNTIVASGSMVHTLHFWFSTKYLDEETGLYYYGYRFYSPDLGRWLSRDPLGERGGINLYSFVLNAPVNKIDPFGFCTLTVVNLTSSPLTGLPGGTDPVGDGSIPLPTDVPGGVGGWYEANPPVPSLQDNQCPKGACGFNLTVSSCSATIWVIVNDPAVIPHEISHFECLQTYHNALGGLVMDTGCDCDTACVAARRNWVFAQANVAAMQYNVCIATRDCAENDGGKISGTFCRALIVAQLRLINEQQKAQSAMVAVQSACAH